MTNGFEKASRLWVNTVLFAATFMAAMTVVPWYGMRYGYGTAAWVSFGVLLAANGLSISAGYHRLWAHRTYEAHWSVRFIYMIFGTMALQNSIPAWCSGHRNHHRYIDDNLRDPYSARRGFWFSHIGWMLRDYPSGKRDDSTIPDVMRDPIAAFQDRHYVPLVLFTNIGIPLAIGWLAGDLLGVFLLGGLLRLVVSHHTTFFINSLAHAWGTQPYTDANTARDNGLLAFLTYGEGYHNFHHCYAGDYRNGVRWWQWDPAKWLIYALSTVGLASNLRRVPDVKIQHARLERLFKVIEGKLAHREQRSPQQRFERIRAHLSTEYETFKQVFEHWRNTREHRQAARRAESYRFTRETLARMRKVQRRLRVLDAQIARA